MAEFGLRSLIPALRQHWRPVLAVHLIFTLLGIVLLTPLFGLLLQGMVSLSGSAAVADQDIALLLLTPLGMASAILLVSIFLAIAGLELGALQAIAQGAVHSLTLKPTAAARYSLHRALPLLQLTLGLTLRVLVYLLPWLAMVGGVAWFLLTDHDINYYLSRRPPEFLAALAAGGLLTLLLAWLLGRRLLGWSLVLPLVMFADTPPARAFAASETLTKGKLGTCARALLGWLAVALLLLAVPALLLSLVTGWIVSAGTQNLGVLIFLLGATAVAWSLANLLVTALNLGGFTLVVASLHQQLAPPLPASTVAGALANVDQPAAGSRSSTGMVAALVVAAALALVAGGLLLRNINVEDNVLIVAHRGAAGAAPENTLASVRRAIEDGADWIEIDVQESRDGRVVVVHDSDFMKLAGEPLKVWDGDLADIQSIDVGSWFDPAFADERVPTLEQVLAEINGRSKLVIELKYYGHDEQLEKRVVEVVEAAGMADDVVVMSLKLGGVQKLQALRPEWTVGLLAATAVGDLAKLDVDFLAVNQNMARPAFVRRAHKAGKQVFVWTINDGLSLSRWMSAGVDGVITDEPALARDILAQRSELSSAQRLMLSAALFFGRPEVAKKYRDNSP